MSQTPIDRAKKAEIEEQKRKRVLNAIELRISRMRVESQNGGGQRLEADSERINEILSDPLVPPEFRRRCQDEMKIVLRDAYKRDVDVLLEVAIAKARLGDMAAERETLKQGREAFTKAMRFGAGEEFKNLVRMKIDIIQSTTGEGKSEKAKRPIEEKPPAREPTAEEKMRRFLRYEDPPLMVKLAGGVFQTLDWSLGGMQLRDCTVNPPMGEVFDLGLSVADDSKWFKVQAQTVRYNPTNHTLAVRFEHHQTALLPIMNRLRELGLTPR